MPVYVFKDSEGKEIDKWFDFSTVPSIGDVIVVDGVEYSRVPSFNLDAAGIARKTHKYPYVSRTLPRNLEGCEVNKAGQPIIKSQAHERNVAAQHDMGKD